MISRRGLMGAAASILAFPSARRLFGAVPSGAAERRDLPYTPVITPNGSRLPWKMENGVKVFHLIAEPVKSEFAPGLVVNCWGYNGQTPGPTIEAVEGDRVRILVTNRLGEPTSVHWHGILVPNGMDGVAGLNQKAIAPGETYRYEFTLRQHGTQMYHPHSDEMTQMAMGMMGFFVIHPRVAPTPRIDRDFCIFLAEWAIKPGTATPNPIVMTDFNVFTFNSTVFPATESLVVKQGQRVRIRLANLSMDSHPIHIHGHKWYLTGTDGGRIPPSAWTPETTINVPPGTTRDVEFVADAPGDWGLHCHKTHHVMNQMGHDVPNMLGVDQSGVEDRVNALVPGYMAMGQFGMGGMMMMGAPPNSIPMLGGEGPFGTIDMGGMFTVVKIRENLKSYADPGWYEYPKGTVASPVEGSKAEPSPGGHKHGHGHGS
jgi:FtsP/CotA-like multicopper oxidase with cupredoxin domain